MTLSTRSCFESERFWLSLTRWNLNHCAFLVSFAALAAGCDDDSNRDEPGPTTGGHGGEIVITIEPEPHPITGCLYLDRMICESYEPPEGCVCHDNAPAPHELCDDPGDYTCQHVAIVPDWRSSEIPYAGCSCSDDAPRHPDDCESAVDFRCVNPDEPFGCLCEAGSPETPEDCATPERFFCQQYEPYRTGCSCAGRTEEECRSQNEHAGIQCISNDPMLGCWCVYAGP